MAKRVEIKGKVKTRVQKALGDVDLDNLVVYEAIAFNTRPIRKKVPLYQGARADRSLLVEMADALSKESLPLNFNHNTHEGLPKGRVFHGEVVDLGKESELRVLFTVDPTETDAISKIDNGTVDQVSVSVLPKQLISSKSGFDYLGADSTFDHKWTGTDPDGHTLGQKGVYGIMKGLDSFMEVSLVGRGGATGARIVSRDQSHFGSSYSKLAASGFDPNVFVLNAGAEPLETPTVDFEKLVAQLTDQSAKLALADNAVANLTADRDARDATITELRASITALEARDAPEQIVNLTAERDTAVTERDAAKVELTAALEGLKKVATLVLTAAGKGNEALPEAAADLVTLIDSTSTSLAAVLVAGGRSTPADTGSGAPKTQVADLSVFKTRRNA